MAEITIDRESVITGFSVAKENGTFKVTYRDTYSTLSGEVLMQKARTESYSAGNAPNWVQNWLPAYAAWLTDPETNQVPAGIDIIE